MIGKKINQLATELAPVSTDLTIIGDPDSGVSKKITLAQLGAIFSGAVSFYSNLASFPAVGDINVIYCAKDTQKLYLWSGSAYVEVFPSQALLNTYQLRSEKGVSNGYASLDSGGKVPISQLPSSIMEYKGTWNASTNTPTLANGTGDTGDVFLCNVAGTVNFGAGPITFAVGDYTIYSGSIWQRSSGAVGTVTSVAASITGDSVTISGSPVTTSGTLAFAFAGNSTQYINGAGNLVTFPGVINEAQNLITEVYNKTGATLTKGTVVYINGGQGNLPTITKALATSDSTSAQTYGIVRNDITNNNNGYVVVAGRISDLDTQAYTEGTQLYLSPTTAGTYTSTKAYAPNHLVYVGIVVRAHPTQGVIEVKIQNGYEMDELHNVAAQTPTNNDGLFWESATSLWKNKSIATVLGYTPISGTGASGQVTYFNGTTSVTGNNNFFWDTANNRLGIGTTTPQRSIEIYNTTADNHLRLSGNAPSVSMGEAVTGSVYQAKFGLVTVNGQFASAGLAGDFVIISQTGATIFVTNSTEKMRVQASGNMCVGNTNNTFKLDVTGTGRFTGQLRLESTITDGTNTYTLPSATGTLALTSQLTGGTVTSVGLSSATSGVTIGSTPITTSGTITLAIATASGSQQGLLSSTDWTTFNNKQNALTNPVTGTGTTNYLPKFTGASTIGNSLVYDSGTGIVIGGAVTTNGFLEIIKSGSSIAQFSFGQSTTYRTDFFVDATGNFYIQPQGTTRLTLSASGNLGLGVTPSAWGSNVTAFELPQAVALYSWSASAVPQLYLGANHYWDGSNWRYKITGQLSTLYYQAVGQHQWFTAPSGTAGNAISFTQAMTLDASGRLGIGVTSPGARLDVLSTYASDTTSQTIFRDNTGVALNFGGTSSGSKFLQAQDSTGATTYYNLLLNPRGGNVGIGTTSPSYRLHAEVSSANVAYFNRATTDGDVLTLAVGGNNAFVFNTSSSTRNIQASGAVDMTMWTNGNERMRIRSSGEVLVNTASLGTYGKFSSYTNDGIAAGRFVSGPSTADGSIVLMVDKYSTTNTTSQWFLGFTINNQGTASGVITANGASQAAFGSWSDFRLKENITNLPSQLDKIMSLRPVEFDYIKSEGGGHQISFIAQEFEKVFPDAVGQRADGMKTLTGWGKTEAILVKAIQELKQELDTLKNK